MGMHADPRHNFVFCHNCLSLIANTVRGAPSSSIVWFLCPMIVTRFMKSHTCRYHSRGEKRALFSTVKWSSLGVLACVDDVV